MRELVVSLFLISAPAFADPEPVRDDIVELRHARYPNRMTVLGWTADGRFVVHEASCGTNDGGGDFCSIRLHVTDLVRDDAKLIFAPTR
jgi:hypothetical protein